MSENSLIFLTHFHSPCQVINHTFRTFVEILLPLKKVLFEIVIWVCFPKEKLAVKVKTLMNLGNFMVSALFFLDNSEMHHATQRQE